MKKGKLVYNCVNSTVILAAIALFTWNNIHFMQYFTDMNWERVLFLTVTAIIVHVIKAARLYLALYGCDISFFNYIKIYCKVTPVSVIFPFKTGEIFRMYCYGRQIGSILKGIVIILIDRFMDTVALMVAILLVWFFMGGEISLIAEFLLVFLALSLLVYATFPGIYRFWKQYLLKANASDNKLRALKLLDTCYRIYHEVEDVVKGRGVLLLLMSMAAWTVEIGCVILLNRRMGKEIDKLVISNYLSSAMGMGTSVYLKQFIFVSVLLLLLVYVWTKLSGMASGKGRDESSRNI